MWFRFWRPDYFYVRHATLIDASDSSPFNRGWSQGFGFFVLTVRWNEGRSVGHDGIHIPAPPAPNRINVNGDEFSWGSDTISFENVCSLARQSRWATVMYHRAKGEKPTGILMAGQSVAIQDGTIFNAVVTGSA